MKEQNGYAFKEFGSNLLVQALKNCSKETRSEFADELEKIRKDLL